MWYLQSAGHGKQLLRRSDIRHRVLHPRPQFSKFVAPGATRVYSSNAPGFVSVGVQESGRIKDTGGLQRRAGATIVQCFLGNSVIHIFTSWTLRGDLRVEWNSERILQSGRDIANPGIKLQRRIWIGDGDYSDSGGGYDVGFADNWDWTRYRNVNFGSGVSSVSLRTASAGSGGTLEFHLDA